MNILLKIFQQSSWQIVTKVVVSSSTFIILGIVSRTFGEEGMGVFTLALIYLNFFYLASEVGFNAYLLPRLIEKNSSTVFKKLLGLRLFWAALLMLIAFLLLPFVPFTNPLFNQSIIIALPAILGYTLFITALAIFQARLRYDLSFLAQLLGAVVTLPMIFWLSRRGYAVTTLTAAHMLGWLVCGACSLFLAKRYTTLSPLFDTTFIKNTLKGVWPISLTLVVNTLYFRIDAFILSSARPFSEVGVYNFAYQIFQTLLTIPTFIMNSYYPIILKELKESASRLKHKLNLAIFVMLFIGSLGAILTYFLAPLTISSLTGSGFEGSVASLRILSLSFPAFFVSAILMWVLIADKKYLLVLAIYLTGLIFSTTLNFLFIPKYSYIAASWITVSAEYLIVFLQVVLFYRLKWGKI